MTNINVAKNNEYYSHFPIAFSFAFKVVCDNIC